MGASVDKLDVSLQGETSYEQRHNDAIDYDGNDDKKDVFLHVIASRLTSVSEKPVNLNAPIVLLPVPDFIANLGADDSFFDTPSTDSNASPEVAADAPISPDVSPDGGADPGANANPGVVDDVPALDNKSPSEDSDNINTAYNVLTEHADELREVLDKGKDDCEDQIGSLLANAEDIVDMNDLVRKLIEHKAELCDPNNYENFANIIEGILSEPKEDQD